MKNEEPGFPMTRDLSIPGSGQDRLFAYHQITYYSIRVAACAAGTQRFNVGRSGQGEVANSLSIVVLPTASRQSKTSAIYCSQKLLFCEYRLSGILRTSGGGLGVIQTKQTQIKHGRSIARRGAHAAKMESRCHSQRCKHYKFTVSCIIERGAKASRPSVLLYLVPTVAS